MLNKNFMPHGYSGLPSKSYFELKQWNYLIYILLEKNSRNFKKNDFGILSISY
jgi:hypothetical protein